MAEQPNNPTGTGATTPHQAAGVIQNLLAGEEEASDQPVVDEQTPAEEQADDETLEAEQLPEDSELTDDSLSADDAEPEEGEVVEPDTEDQVFDVNGEQLTLADLRRGYMQQKDYTQKTQKLSEERQKFVSAAEEQARTIQQERQAAQQERQQLKQYLDELQPEEPDWNKLYNEDPAEYAAQREMWRSWQDRKAEIERKQQEAEQQQQQQYQQQMQQVLQQEQQKLKEAIPEWQDTQTAQNERQKLFNWASRVGYTQEELGQVMDHRALVMARKAMLYDELMDKQKKTAPKTKKASSPKTAKPGAASQRKSSQQKQVEQARNRSRKSGRVDDAASLIELMMSDED